MTTEMKNGIAFETVQSLRNKGYKVRVIHRRKVLLPVMGKHCFLNEERYLTRKEIATLETWNKDHIVSHFGGQTKVEITDKDGNNFVGEARESMLAFNRKVALDVALGRAIKKMDSFTVNV